MRVDPPQLQRAIEQAHRQSAASSAAHRQSAVFALLVDREQGLDRPKARQEQTNLLLIRRADRGDPWSNHIAFPGGHLAPTDADALEAAYRETLEEVGIRPEAITDLGDLGHFETATEQVDLHVFVGLWDGAGPLRVDPVEVAQVIEAPLGWLLGEHRRQGFAGRSVDQLGDALVYPLADTAVWGVTARIMHHLLELIGTLTQPEARDLG